MSYNHSYITTTLPYVNAKPHLGFALELVQADFLARFERLEGSEVFFSTGSDEHGQKVWQKAKEEGIDINEYVNTYSKCFEDLSGLLNISIDNFIRTTSETHISAAQEMWRRIDKNGDIYKKKYSGLYCVGCERFITEKDLVEGKCPDHPTKEPELIEEENYFFSLSKYQDVLLQYLDSEESIIPNFRRKEAIAFVKEGLSDISISREKSRLPWGIPVPGDDSQVMYVWVDALTNYISTLGWPEDEETFEKFWLKGGTLQFAGKDQIRFQSIIWQAMLLSAGLPATQSIFYHGFITSDGTKMSKSIGNVIDPTVLAEEYGVDALRYYLLRHIHPTDDSDVTEEKFTEVYNANLANGIGNLVSRVIKMASSYDVKVSYQEEEEVWFNPDFEEYKEYIRSFEYQKALDWVWEGIGGLDELIAREEPFKKIKSEKESDKEKAREVVAYALLKLWDIAVLIEPALPETSSTMKEYLTNLEVPEPLFARK